MITDWVGGSLLRVEPTRRQENQAEFQCVAENGVGDPVSAKAYIRVYDSKSHACEVMHYFFTHWQNINEPFCRSTAGLSHDQAKPQDESGRERPSRHSGVRG